MKRIIILGVLFFIGLLIVSPVSAEGEKIVCIDPGHGGNTGAYNAMYNLWEDEIVLDISYRLKALLEPAGYQVGMTRTDNTNKSNGDRYNYCNSINADILLSAHINGSNNPDIDGSMALYFDGDDKILAQTIYNVMYPTLRDDPRVQWGFTNFGLTKFASGVLIKSNMPAALMEPVLMSYNPEALLLVDMSNTSRRQMITQTYFDGIINYFANYSGGSGGNPGKGKP
ncbi:hypothetical protein A3H80_04980 [Candidatus Roizmanbacteria bacterium RIFCSPLOWO2_02_FULL_37_19]|uniref:MurNAc-LAA domain-containing protein n=1 Tax=Candidatus Roizmanbacteria bacterium RIFCSPHIGHO2_02_FULL_37_24 TaxID=1802037 RepID=A0A1F7GZ39_9BACT|nr:MAG: hypothetical protein A2862_04395 [Candidatus Roizmanbacteria bacterium RIFCSPHIGHO2_01_FULL_38_41]OGK24158.1 MAG: hypothetical protein A3C24_02705 [Candidatus Roizmanbacteria bacterium RIFCSPHIGHO2_02_FULL_37_24]OGK32049.1 MAG: hypothetical protein A3E10_04905 [Candidatus Roizmanbacteria bacterium RIFCSPHIGHO2_12_FULL_37_23]OGK43984.1 MAG: hypothetical protein A2956_04850 [Candidatus Roizmanbacteria bacterium RIFCSPLOWO2_01_FULL_37_57]OGK55076.1 MAG: hypothetical protein A3H80_04980 [Ca